MKQLINLTLFFALVLAGFWSHAQVYKDTFYVNTYGIDAFVNGASQSSNYGNDSLMPVSWNGSRSTRTFIDVDLSNIPKEAVVLKTELKLYATSVNNAASHDMYVQRVLASWIETGTNEITWNNQPAVTSTDRATISHAQTSSTGIQTMEITALGRFAVNHPEINFGWRIGLTSESGTARGVTYCTSEHPKSQRKPYVIVEYVLPLEITATVKHCSYGLNNGSIDVSVDAGSGTYSSYTWYKYSNGTVTTIQSSGSGISTIDIDSLTDGLYLCTVTDNRGTIGYKYFLLGKYGTTTTVEFRNNSNSTNAALFNEDALIVKTFTPTLDSTREGGAEVVSNAYRSSSASYTAALMKFNVDFDSLFEITQADLRLISAGHYKSSSPVTTDSGYVSRVKQNWYEGFVTWGTKPTLTTVDRITIDETSPAGAVNRNDTIDLLNFVELWQEYPDSNFGVDLSLKKYTQSADAYLRYHSTDNTTAANRPGFVVTYSLPEQVVVYYSDSTGLGSIDLVAPNGELPYTYVIGYDTIPDITDIWGDLKDSVSIDSATFVRGKSNTHRYRFSDLLPERYYITVFDNNAERIYDTLIYLKPEIDYFTTIGVDDTLGDTVQVAFGALYGAASMDRVLYAPDDGGYEFTVGELGDFAFGFNKLDDPLVALTGDLETGFEFFDNGDYEIFVDTGVVYSGEAASNDIFRISRFGNQIIYTHNNDEVYRDTLDTLATADMRLDVLFRGTAGKLLHPIPVNGFRTKLRPAGIKIQQPLCGQSEGVLSISRILSSLFPSYPPSSCSYDIIDLSDNSPVESGTLGSSPDVIAIPPGDYAITFNWSDGTTTETWTQYFSVFYPITWELTNAYFTEVPGTVNSLASNSVYYVGSAESINVLEDDVTTAWLKTHAKPYRYYNPLGAPPVKTFFTATISLMNTAGDDVSGVKLYTLGTNVLTKYVSHLNSLGNYAYSGMFIYNDGPFFIELESGNFNTYYSSMSTTPLVSLTQGTPDDYTVKALGFNGTIYDTYATFCIEVPIPEDLYVEPKRELTGGYYQVQVDDILRFEFNEEYASGNELNYVVRDFKGQIQAGLPTLTEEFGDNRLSLDVSSLLAGVYVLEIRNDKNEAWFLRFKVV